MSRIKVTKAAIKAAQPVVKAYRASGNAGRRYKADDTDAFCLAVLQRLSDLTICEDASKPGKRKHLAENGDYIAEDWYSVHPAMSPSTRPDQGIESRLLTNLALAGDVPGWGWYNDSDKGFILVRTS